MQALNYTITQTFDKKPLVIFRDVDGVFGPFGHLLEMQPDTLRRLASELVKIADAAEGHGMGNEFQPLDVTTQF